MFYLIQYTNHDNSNFFDFIKKKSPDKYKTYQGFLFKRFIVKYFYTVAVAIASSIKPKYVTSPTLTSKLKSRLL